MLALYFSVILVFFLRLRAVNTRFMATDEDAKKGIDNFGSYGCSGMVTDAQVRQYIKCEKAIDMEFYQKTKEAATTGQCKDLVTDQSDDVSLRLCKTLKGPDDPNSIKFMKCLFNAAGRASRPDKPLTNPECVKVT